MDDNVRDLLKCTFPSNTISLFRKNGNNLDSAIIQCLNPVVKPSVSDYVDVNFKGK